jgi:hypothetical protein
MLVSSRDRLTLGVGVEDVQCDAELAGALEQHAVELAGRGRPVQLGLAAAQILHVGTLDQQQFHDSSIEQLAIELNPVPCTQTAVAQATGVTLSCEPVAAVPRVGDLQWST